MADLAIKNNVEDQNSFQKFQFKDKKRGGGCKILIFTMQTLKNFNGDFLGELMVIDNLEQSLKEFGCTCHRIRGDQELNMVNHIFWNFLH